MSKKLKPLVLTDATYYLCLIVLVAIIAFGLGRYSVTAPVQQAITTPKPTVQLLSEPARGSDQLTVSVDNVGPNSVVASQNGRRYYQLDCSGVDRIQPENRLYFLDEHRAEAAGYTPSVSCYE